MFDTNQLRGPFYGLPDAGFSSSLDSSSLTATREAIAIHVKAIDRKFYAIHALWNWVATINRLPDEIMIEIFSLANPKRQSSCEPQLPPTRATDPPQIGAPSWAPLMLVCRHWHALILQNPRLWRAIDVSKGFPHHLLFACRYGRKATLELAFHGPKSVRVLPLLDFVTPRISRLLLPPLECKYLRLALVALGHLQWPKLEELTVLSQCQYPARHASGPQIDLAKERLPMLSSLCLSSLAISWEVGLVSRLRRLELVDCSHFGSPLTLDAFLDVLDVSPHLEELRLHNFLSSIESTCARGSRRTIFLPGLKNFGLHDDLARMLEVLNSVHFPPEARVHIGAESAIQNADGSGDLIAWKVDLRQVLPEDRLRLPLLDSAHSGRIEALDGVVRAIGIAGDAHLVFDLDTKLEFGEWTAMLVPQAIRGFVGLFCRSDIREVVIVGSTQNLDEYDYYEVLEQFLELEVLRIEDQWDEDYVGGSHKVEDVFDILRFVTGRPGMHEDDEWDQFILGPSLKTLDLVALEWTGGSLDAIKRSLRFRAEHGHFLQELRLELHFPTIPSKRDFEAFKLRTCAELRELVPSGKVTIERAVACQCAHHEH
ncbi:hypothetical protein BV20DRAFT_966325 [Pilatotrama ljubarskyi]|nr:hypothetical protein BV20DRAFT_966325 [Pilatotrama ljubarskyi]